MHTALEGQRLAASYRVSSTLCAFTLYSFGGAQDSVPEFWDDIKGRCGRVETFNVFGPCSAATFARSKSLADFRPLAQARGAVWVEQTLGFKPTELERYLAGCSAPLGPEPDPASFPLAAVVLVKLRDDALLQDSHLLPPAFIEVACSRIARVCRDRPMHCDGWLPVGAADVLLLLRAKSLMDIARAVGVVRALTLGDLMPVARPERCGPFTQALNDALDLRPSEDVQDWFDDCPGGPWKGGPAEFIRDLRVVSSTQTVVGLQELLTSRLASHCGTIARLPTVAAARDPIARLRELCDAAFCPESPLVTELRQAGLGDEGDRGVAVTCKVRVRPGRDHVADLVLETLRTAAIRAFLGEPSAMDPRGTFGIHDAILVAPNCKLPFIAVVAALAVLRYSCMDDPLLRRRFQHLIRGTFTSFAWPRRAWPPRPDRGTGAESPTPTELCAFGDDERDPSKMCIQALLHQRLPLRLHQLELKVGDWNPRLHAWLPRHVHRAAERLINLFNAGLREPAAAIYLLDLLPALRTLVQLIRTCAPVAQTGTRADWNTWLPIPSLHGGHASRSELTERALVPKLVESIRLLDLGLRQRLRHAVTEEPGDTSLELAANRHKWLSGIAVLVSAFSEHMLPDPDIFRWPGIVLLDILDRPLEVIQPSAFVRIGHDILEQPEMLLCLYQEIGHVSLRAAIHRQATTEMRRTVDDLVRAYASDPRSDARDLNLLLEELFCDLSLVFLGFGGDLHDYARFIVRRVAQLAPHAPVHQRHSVIVRLFALFVLLDREDRWRDEAEKAGAKGAGAIAALVKSRPGDSADVRLDVMAAGPRFADLLAPLIREQDVWDLQGELFAASKPWDVDTQRSMKEKVEANFHLPLWRMMYASGCDAASVLSLERLAHFRIAGRTVEKWLRNLGRVRRETRAGRSEAQAAQPLLADGIPVRNLHWLGAARRAWPGLPADEAAQRRLLSASPFPLVVPADMSGWCSDARAIALAERSEVPDSERVALLQSLWTASQGMKLLHVAKARQEAGTNRDTGWVGAQKDEAGFLVELFVLAPRAAPPAARVVRRSQ